MHAAWNPRVEYAARVAFRVPAYHRGTEQRHARRRSSYAACAHVRGRRFCQQKIGQCIGRASNESTDRDLIESEQLTGLARGAAAVFRVDREETPAGVFDSSTTGPTRWRSQWSGRAGLKGGNAGGRICWIRTVPPCRSRTARAAVHRPAATQLLSDKKERYPRRRANDLRSSNG